MSTTPTMRTPETTPGDRPRTGETSFAMRNAQRTFDPFNTEDCPRMFSDKWSGEDPR